MLNGSRRLWRAAGPVRFVARRLNTSSIRPRRASRPGLLAPPGLGPPFNTSLLEIRANAEADVDIEVQRRKDPQSGRDFEIDLKPLRPAECQVQSDRHARKKRR